MRAPLILKLTASEGEYLLRVLRREIGNGSDDPDLLSLAKKMARVWLERESEYTLRALAVKRERSLAGSGGIHTVNGKRKRSRATVK